ncbi:UNVERIFIED_CONTAM: hypothetical protein FKN15_014653 [Acipenser sinensis]
MLRNLKFKCENCQNDYLGGSSVKQLKKHVGTYNTIFRNLATYSLTSMERMLTSSTNFNHKYKPNPNHNPNSNHIPSTIRRPNPNPTSKP